jgi:hypothetical protein
MPDIRQHPQGFLGKGAVETLRFGVGVDDEEVYKETLRIMIIQLVPKGP